MTSWKICIDSHQQRALDLCCGSFDRGDGGPLRMILGSDAGDGNDQGYGSRRRPGDGFGSSFCYPFDTSDGRSTLKW